MDSQRLALLLPHMGGGGAERVALTLIKGFAEAGNSIDLLLLRSEGEFLSLVPPQVRVVNLRAARFRQAIFPLARYLRRERPAGLLVMMWPMPVIAVIARYLARSETRIIASDHAVLSEHYQGQPRRLAALRLTTRLFYSKCDGIVSASGKIADDLARISGIKRDRFQTILNPIEMPPAGIDVDRETEALWFGTGARILSVGSLKAEKNHALLLRAFAQLLRQRDVALVVLGEGPLRSELEALASELGIADRVEMPGFRANPWPLYASADLFVLSSTSEGFGNVLVEAMAVGLPVVSTDCAGPREVLGGGEYGRLTPSGDVQALAEAMAETLDDPGRADERKARASEFRPERAVREFLDLVTGAN